MTRKAVLPIAFAIALAAMLHALPAHAQQTYTAVSARTSLLPGPIPGSESCGKITNPCTTLQEAYAVTAAGGVIDVLTPGDYGPLAISNSINIQGHGFATITATSGDAITINATSNINVTLSGLILQGAGSGAHGVFLASTVTSTTPYATLNILDCVVANFTDSGIAIQPTAPSNATFFMLVANTSSLNNGEDGIKIAPASSADVVGTISQTRVAANGDSGFEVDGNSLAYVRDSIAVNNTKYQVNVGSSTAQVALFHNNTVSSLTNSGTVYSDGTNDIEYANGTPLSEVGTQ